MDEPDDDFTEPAAPRRRSSHRTPWSRIAMAISIGLPALLIGGVPPWVVVGFAVTVTGLWVRLCTRSKEPLRVPNAAAIGVLLAVIAWIQWVPIESLRPLFASGLDAKIAAALEGTGAEAWAGISPTPADTGLEAARLAALSLLFVAAAQLSWRVTATIIAVTGTVVALVGYGHEAFGAVRIWGLYAPISTDPAGSPALLATFVNANHQSGMLLLGIFCAGALAADQHILGLNSIDPSKVDRYGDRFLTAMTALALQLPAMVLSLSRGALVAAIVVAPAALWLGLRRQRARHQDQRRRSRRLSPARFVVLVVFVGLFALVAQHGAWRELATLLDITEPGAQMELKHRIALEAPALLELSPVFGVGRGAFIDLFPGIDSHPGPVLHTHLEALPAAALVEFGPLGGAILVLGGGVWVWSAWRAAAGRRGTAARRIAVLGLVALAVQSLGDFSLEFLGVAAPACALAGALSPDGRFQWAAKPALRIGTAMGVLATVLAFVSAPDSMFHRTAHDTALRDGERSLAKTLRTRPLDARVHVIEARRAAEAGDWAAAEIRSRVATELNPGLIDGWLLHSAALGRAGQDAEADDAMRRALNLLRRPPDEALLGFLIERYPTPAALARVGPEDPAAWKLLGRALLVDHPAYADAIGQARQAADPDDPEPMRLRFDVAMRERNAALALHHARIYRQLAPDSAAAHLAVIKAYRLFAPPREADARDAADEALAGETIVDRAELGLIEEQLITSLVRLAEPSGIARARELLPVLMQRPASRPVRKRREALAQRLDELP